MGIREGPGCWGFGVSMASAFSEMVEIEADGSDPTVVGVLGSWVGRATLKLRRDRPSTRPGTRRI